MTRSCLPALSALPRGVAGSLRSLLLLFAVALFPASAVPQSIPDLASQHVLSIVEDMEIIADDGGPFETRVARISALVDRAVARMAVARYVAGASWNSADTMSREAYLSAYGRYLDVLIARRLETYTGEHIEHLGGRSLDDGDSLVAFRINNDGEAVRIVQWRVRITDAGPRILDIIVDGVSMAANQREEFAAIHGGSTEGIELLIEALLGQTERMLVAP